MDVREIRRLRRKFILISMVSIMLAMVFIGGLLNGILGGLSRYSIHIYLDELVNSMGNQAGGDGIDDYFSDPGISDVIITRQNDTPYYVFVFNESGDVVKTTTNVEDVSMISSAQEKAWELVGTGKKSGRIGMYYYKTKVTETGLSILAFVDGSTEVATSIRLLYITIAICMLGLLITLGLVWKLSAHMIKPEIENIRRQKQFITNASHELKTPLAVIRANTEMQELLHGEDEWTQSTVRQIDHLNGLIQNLVMITRASEQEDKTEMQEIDVVKAVRESIDPFEPLAKQEEKTILRNLDPDVKMVADESKIRQLTSLLVDNAIKYCDEDGVVMIALTSYRKGIELTVSNHYAAGADVDYKQFFDRFYREDDSHNIDKGGYGIGLSIAESICSQYGGDIHVEWKDGIISFICRLL